MTAAEGLVASYAALTDVVEAARQAGVVAVDTEFVWEQTYYPRLGLVQLAWGGGDPQAGGAETALVDTVALAGPDGRSDLRPLGALLADEAVTKVLHDAQQDLTILRRATLAEPRAVFDTQRAAGFVGLSGTMSLADLLRETVGVSLAKGETRTDWVRRPLTPAQLDYAADDVRYLLEARRRLLDRARTRGREAWVLEEMARYDEAELYVEPDPALAYERLKAQGLGRLSPHQRAVLREVAAWRDREARALDRTRRFVLPDEALAEVARLGPVDLDGLRRAGLTDKQLARYGDGLLAAVRRGLETPPEARPQREPPLPDEERVAARTLLVQALVAGRSARQGMDAALVAPKAEVRALAAAGASARPAEHALLQGWRRAFIGYDLLALLDGRAGVTVDPEDGWPRFRPFEA